MKLLKGPESWAIAGALTVAVVVAGRWVIAVPSLDGPQPYLSRGLLDSLEPYVIPGQVLTPMAPGVIGTAAWPDPFDPPRASDAVAGVGGGGLMRVTAILITEERRVAIIDDQIVSPGDLLPGGGRIDAIEPEQVVVAHQGRREVLRLALGGWR